MVVHICNPSYAESIGRRIILEASPRQKHEALKNNLKQKGLEILLK
jgi:uncharacterized protein (DUF302 family)